MATFEVCDELRGIDPGFEARRALDGWHRPESPQSLDEHGHMARAQRQSAPPIRIAEVDDNSRSAELRELATAVKQYGSLEPFESVLLADPLAECQLRELDCHLIGRSGELASKIGWVPSYRRLLGSSERIVLAVGSEIGPQAIDLTPLVSVFLLRRKPRGAAHTLAATQS